MEKNKIMKHISNEQKAREIANNNCTHICLADCSAESYFGSENDCYKAAMQAMEWKDEQHAKEKQQWIDKACDTIKHLLGGYVIRNFHFGDSYDMDEIVNDFKKSMKGEQ